ncbi:MAG: hypothetical protein WCH39_27445, partial [Schlesneria sp.]
IAAPGMVDDEARGVAGAHRRVPHFAGERIELGAHRRAGFQTRHHFHHLHQGHRVEEMKTALVKLNTEIEAEGPDWWKNYDQEEKSVNKNKELKTE